MSRVAKSTASEETQKAGIGWAASAGKSAI